jgi:hypothetical protein
MHAEDDDVDGVHQSLVYYAALAKVRVPVAMHLYEHGGHAFGCGERSSQLPAGPGMAADDWHRRGLRNAVFATRARCGGQQAHWADDAFQNTRLFYA